MSWTSPAPAPTCCPVGTSGCNPLVWASSGWATGQRRARAPATPTSASRSRAAGGANTNLALRSPFDPLTVTKTAARFETGAYGNFGGALALALNAERLCDEGPRDVERRVLERGDHLLAGLEQRGLPVVSPLEPEHRSGSITFHMPGGREQELALSRHLDSKNVFIAVRYTSGIGGVRVSPHYFTDLDEIDTFFVELAWFLTKPHGMRREAPWREPSAPTADGAAGGRSLSVMATQHHLFPRSVVLNRPPWLGARITRAVFGLSLPQWAAGVPVLRQEVGRSGRP